MANETIGSSGYDRTNVATWEAAQSADGTGTIMLAEEASGGSGVTIDAAFNLTLTADSSVAVSTPTYASASTKAGLYPDESGYILRATGTSLIVSKLAIICASSGSGSDAGTVQPGSSCSLTVRRCFISRRGKNGRAIDQRLCSATSVWSNCVIVGGKYGAVLNFDGGTLTTYHCSILDASSDGQTSAGFYQLTTGTSNAYATIVQSDGVNGSFIGFTSVGGDYNVSEDATAPGSSSTKYYRSTSGWFTNSSAGSEDLSLAAGAQGKWVTDGKDAIDQTGWPADVATDIVGTTRSAPIDPGVWQTPAAGGGVFSLQHIYRHVAGIGA